MSNPMPVKMPINRCFIMTHSVPALGVLVYSRRHVLAGCATVHGLSVIA